MAEHSPLHFIENCGLQLEPQEDMTVRQIVDWVEIAEDLGFGHIFRSDHFIAVVGTELKHCPECWTTLSLMASRGTKIRFGSMVTPIGFRNPAVLASMACALHSFSGGRLVLGLGAGWYEDEYRANGMTFPDLTSRREELEESLRVIRPLTEGKRVDYDGKHFKVHTVCYPKPEGKISLILGGWSKRIVDLALEYADEYNFYGGHLDSFLKLRGRLEKRKGDLDISIMAPFVFGENPTQLEENIKAIQPFLEPHQLSTEAETQRKYLRQAGWLCGLEEEIVSQINDLRDLGITKFYFQIQNTKRRDMVESLSELLQNKF